MPADIRPMMGHRERIDAVEYDAVNPRYRHAVKWKRDERAELKRDMRRRERHRIRRDLKHEDASENAR